MIENIKGFAADIDMTLTSKGEALPEANKQALEMMHAHGIRMGLATGRVIENNLKTQGKDWGLSFEFDFLVCMNGGQVYDAHTGRLFEKEMLTREEEKKILTALIDIVDANHVAVNAEGGGNQNAMHLEGVLEEAMKRHGWRFTDVTGDIDAFCAVPSFKLLFRTTPEVGEELRARFNETLADEFQIVSTFPGTLEVLHQGIDKGSGVEIYASWYDMSIQDFICFGDNENDNTMLEKAGWGVCLADGNEKSKEVSDDVTDLGCFDGGMGDYMMKNYFQPKGWM